ncbi:MAG: hypothetical protein RR806_06795 [Oscillospiraceae bacterium]
MILSKLMGYSFCEHLMSNKTNNAKFNTYPIQTLGVSVSFNHKKSS